MLVFHGMTHMFSLMNQSQPTLHFTKKCIGNQVSAQGAIIRPYRNHKLKTLLVFNGKIFSFTMVKVIIYKNVCILICICVFVCILMCTYISFIHHGCYIILALMAPFSSTPVYLSVSRCWRIKSVLGAPVLCLSYCWNPRSLYVS
jgi:hypothetical protein